MTGGTSATAAFQIASWDENPYAEFEGVGKLTRAITSQTYTGDLAGESRGDSLMYYGRPDAPVYYTGLERFTGTLGGKTGSFVLQAKGTFTNGVAETSWFVVPGSGTDELAGLRGEGGYKAGHGESAVTANLDYDFEA
jgi:hypothetical protein